MKPLSEFPRIHLGVFPTPLQRLDNISSYLNTNVWIKRDDMTGPGYAVPSKEGNAAIALMARKEGLFLDPVYSGKAFAGLLAMAEEGAFTPEDNVLFVHTGGAGGLFAVDVNLD